MPVIDPASATAIGIRHRPFGALIAGLALLLLSAAPRAAGVGEPAPPFSLVTASGETIALSSLRGRVVYVDFWASWCGPCRYSFPWMNEMQQRYGERGLSIVAVNVDRQRADATRFLTAHPARFTVVYDDQGATPESFGVKAMPSSYLVDPQGKIVDVEFGFTDDRARALENRIRALVTNR